MNIAPIFSYKNSFILNFCSNINFRPVRTKEDAKIAAELYAHMSTFNPHKPLAKFLQNANHKLEQSFATDLFDMSRDNAKNHHIEIAEKDGSVVGAYSLDYKKGYPTAYVDFMVESPKIRQTQLSKEFLLALADRICEIAANNNIQNIRWNASMRNARALNLYKKRFDADTYVDLKSNNVIYTIPFTNFKKQIDDYKSKH